MVPSRGLDLIETRRATIAPPETFLRPSPSRTRAEIPCRTRLDPRRRIGRRHERVPRSDSSQLKRRSGLRAGNPRHRMASCKLGLATPPSPFPRPSSKPGPVRRPSRCSTMNGRCGRRAPAHRPGGSRDRHARTNRWDHRGLARSAGALPPLRATSSRPRPEPGANRPARGDHAADGLATVRGPHAKNGTGRSRRDVPSRTCRRRRDVIIAICASPWV